MASSRYHAVRASVYSVSHVSLFTVSHVSIFTLLPVHKLALPTVSQQSRHDQKKVK